MCTYEKYFALFIILNAFLFKKNCILFIRKLYAAIVAFKVT